MKKVTISSGQYSFYKRVRQERVTCIRGMPDLASCRLIRLQLPLNGTL